MALDDEGPATLPESVTSTAGTSKEDYSTQGRTTVATRRGYAFQPTDKDLPLIDHTGVTVTKEQAEALVTDSGGVVHIVENKED